MRHKNIIGTASIATIMLMLTACGTTPTEDRLSDSGSQEVLGAADTRLVYAEVEEDTVVGSRIKQTGGEVEDSATPVRVYDRDDMRRNGARSVGGFLGGINR